MRSLPFISLILVIIGGLNWLIIGLFDRNIVAEVFGGTENDILLRIVYILVGAAAIYLLVNLSKYRRI
ncbi:DUF378 domain-containing protein [Paenibacillus sp. GCM10023252]|uniref:DUF378 domain-containing protein n=1 Tax=Paenibacillus sp. GCM10023252 TaxID=3252649 RepID=UPI0036180FDF